MKKQIAIGVIALATLAAPMAASAQSWRGHDRDRDGRYERWERRADHNRRDGGPLHRPRALRRLASAASATSGATTAATTATTAAGVAAR